MFDLWQHQHGKLVLIWVQFKILNPKHLVSCCAYREREAKEASWMYPTQLLLAQLRAELDLDDSAREGSGSCEDSRYRRPWHWLPEMRCACPPTSPPYCNQKTLHAQFGAVESTATVTNLRSYPRR